LACKGSVQIISKAAPRMPTDIGSKTRTIHLQIVGKRAPSSFGLNCAHRIR
jgi:hypothetical protein